MPVCVISMSLRRSSASATTPLMSENATIGTTRTRPTRPSASPRWAGGTITETCHRIAAFCIMEPAIDTSWLVQSRRKLRCWSATKGEARGASGVMAASCQTGPGRSTRRWCRARLPDYTRAMVRRAWWHSLQAGERTALLAASSGWALGWGAAAIVYALVFSLLPASLAWRALFWTGVLPALLILYIRRRVREPARPGAALADPPGRSLEIFAPGLLRTTLLASLMATGMQGGYYAITTWLPTYLKTVRGLSVLDTGGYLLVIITGAYAGYLTGAWACDALGRRATFILFALGSLLIAVSYTLIPIGDRAMLVLGFPLGFFVSGNFSGVGAFFAELFPGRVRGSGMGFAYSFGRGVGAAFPALVGFLSARIALGVAIGAFAAFAYLIVLAAVLALPETRGRPLERATSAG